MAKTKKQTLAQSLAASAPRARSGWKFSAAAVKDINEAIAINKSGSGYIAALRLAKALKAKYRLSASVGALRDRLAEMAGGRW